jgi:hypothetical protein
MSMVAMERKTMIVTMATKQPHFASSKKSKKIRIFIHGNHSHNLRLKVNLVVSLVIIYVKMIISVNTF